MPPRWNENRLTAKLGIDYPVIQGPLGGLSSQKLTAAVSNFGGLGSFGAHGLAPEAIKDVIGEIRSLTSKPFAMNLWVSMEDEGPEYRTKTPSIGALPRLPSISPPWGRLVRHTNRIRRSDLKIRLACCWTRTSRYSASSSEFHQKRFWMSAGRIASSRLARRPHPRRVRHFKRPESMPSSHPALKQADIAVHSSEPQRIHSQARFRLSRKSSTGSMCQ